MSLDGSDKGEENVVDVLFEQEVVESSEEPPQEEWSSLLCFLAVPQENEKLRLYAEGLYEPPSKEICAKYIELSDSSIYRHPLYPYPALLDPGIEDALLQPPQIIEYADNGQDLYLAICEEMGEAYCRLFHYQLIRENMDLSYYGISKLGWRAMALALMKNRIVQSINFTSNYISQDGCFHFGELLRENFTIAELDFTGCCMGEKGLMLLVANLHKNLSLRKLNLAKNLLNDKGFEYLATAIYKGARISDINVSSNNLTTKSAVALSDAIEYINKISNLDMSWNSLTVPKHVETLINRFIESETFVEINFAWNAMSSRFTKALVTLFYCPNIRYINISNNNLNGEAITKIGASLGEAKKLQTLDISYNPMSPLDAFLLLKYMRFRKVKLNNLLMDGVYVSEEFVQLRNRILNLKFRKDSTTITHGYVIPKFVSHPADYRAIVLRRTQVICNKPKKKRVDVGAMILQVNKERKGACIQSRDLLRIFREMGAFQIKEDLADEFGVAFPGPRSGNVRTVNIGLMADYVHRFWPEARAPPTPPPPQPPPPPPIKPAEKGKKGTKTK